MNHVGTVLLLDALANTNDAAGVEQARSVISWGETLSFVPIIFDHTTNRKLLIGVITTFDHHVKFNWVIFGRPLILCGFMESGLSRSFGNDAVDAHLRKAFVIMIVRSSPDDRAAFLADSVDFRLLSKFVDVLGSLNATVVPVDPADCARIVPALDSTSACSRATGRGWKSFGRPTRG
jgi:hypothetical protein